MCGGFACESRAGGLRRARRARWFAGLRMGAGRRLGITIRARERCDDDRGARGETEHAGGTACRTDVPAPVCRDRASRRPAPKLARPPPRASPGSPRTARCRRGARPCRSPSRSASRVRWRAGGRPALRASAARSDLAGTSSSSRSSGRSPRKSRACAWHIEGVDAAPGRRRPARVRAEERARRRCRRRAAGAGSLRVRLAQPQGAAAGAHRSRERRSHLAAALAVLQRGRHALAQVRAARRDARERARESAGAARRLRQPTRRRGPRPARTTGRSAASTSSRCCRSPPRARGGASTPAPICARSDCRSATVVIDNGSRKSIWRVPELGHRSRPPAQPQLDRRPGQDRIRCRALDPQLPHLRARERQHPAARRLRAGAGAARAGAHAAAAGGAWRASTCRCGATRSSTSPAPARS